MVKRADKLSITVVGGGVLGLWQAFELSRRGHRVTLKEAMPEAETGAASRYAGAMLAPFCETEGAEPIIEALGLEAIPRWRDAYPGVVVRGSLVVAGARDQGEITRFARMTRGHTAVDASGLAELEPDLTGRFSRGLFYGEEAHLVPRPALQFLIGCLRRSQVALRFGGAVATPMRNAAAAGEAVIDCRGMAAREDLPELRGVRGEMAVLRASGVNLTRPVRLLHPRFPIYVVPWGDGMFMVGATVIESEDMGPVTVRSALELLGTAYALHPAFGEAEIVEVGAGVRPAFPDNLPKVIVRGRHIHANGAYRHGFLLAPLLAGVVADYLETGAVRADLMRIE